MEGVHPLQKPTMLQSSGAAEEHVSVDAEVCLTLEHAAADISAQLCIGWHGAADEHVSVVTVNEY